jgi:hypothetical protein
VPYLLRPGGFARLRNAKSLSANCRLLIRAKAEGFLSRRVSETCFSPSRRLTVFVRSKTLTTSIALFSFFGMKQLLDTRIGNPGLKAH